MALRGIVEIFIFGAQLMKTIFKWFSVILILCSLAIHVQADSDMAAGFTKIKSSHSVTTTLDRLEAVLAKKGMKVFARINHAKGAKSVGIELRPTELLIFGNPKVGAPLMACQQTVALDLPQKALAWQDETGQVWLVYNQPDYLEARHKIEGCQAVLSKVSQALAKFVAHATGEI